MAKSRRVFVCRECGGAQSRWLGKCPDCGQWDSLEETSVDPSAADPRVAITAGWADGELQAPHEAIPTPAKPLSEIDADAPDARRLACGIGELDRVLGGGLVAGSAVLIGGEPGIGKSTLLLQAAFAWAAGGQRVLYVSSEESAHQVGLRARRLAGGAAEPGGAPSPHAVTPATDNLFILSETNLARIIEQARKLGPGVIVIDSVQMVFRSELPAAPGSVAQVRRCCADLVAVAKASGIGVVLVGHVTKDGRLAGPRLLEHLVDAVVSFEGDRYHSHRVVRAIKNRFGTTLEIGLFEMTSQGLRETTDGGAPISQDDPPRSGCVHCPVMTGTRGMLVEIQALTATGFLGAAKRKSAGLDPNRLAMLIAVLEQHAELRLADRDVFASSVGGVRISEPAADLALALAIAGAHYRRATPPACAAVGEVGLGGEVRPIPHAEARVREAARLGVKTLLLPPLAKGERGSLKNAAPGVKLVEVKNINQAIEHLS
ncbi:MAG: DNA repair protein RadA [Phycisphaeraceae bacterium]|nr:DNA repair protein RadA [Phycisphaeraceae bacterium]